MTIEEVLREASALVTPGPELAKEAREISTRFTEYVESLLLRLGIEGEVKPLGSSARDTWLPENADVDIFIILPRRYERGLIDALVEKIKAEMLRDGIVAETRYAEHPYVVVREGRWEVDVVPCFQISPGERPLTAADRSPLHHAYLSARLDERLRLEVRLLKRFLKTIGVYGAEVKVEGFSGYLAELLTVHFGSFISVLKNAATWRPYRTVIDPAGHYGDPRELRRKFKSPLVVVDPVDPNRNVAAAVSLTSFSTFVLAARRFLKSPSLSYFVPRRSDSYVPVPALVIKFEYPHKSPDVVWGMFKRYARALANKLEECGFKVMRVGVDSDERTYVDVALLLESPRLPEFELHRGPPAYSESADKFVEKYLGQDVVGPFVEGTRVYVIRRRRVQDAEMCIKKALKELGLSPTEIKLGVYPPLSGGNPWIT